MSNELIRWPFSEGRNDYELIVERSGKASVFDRSSYLNSRHKTAERVFMDLAMDEQGQEPYTYPIKIGFDLYYSLREVAKRMDAETDLSDSEVDQIEAMVQSTFVRPQLALV